MLQGARELNIKLDRFASRLDGIAKTVAQESVADVAKAVRGDLGDTSMSGWKRGKPVEIVGAYKVTGPGTAEVTPKGRTAGPMRVLQSGRNSEGGAGGFQGPGINFRTGNTSARARSTGRGGSSKGRRWNGRTQGKGTWDDAQHLVESQVGKRAGNAMALMMAAIFNKG